MTDAQAATIQISEYTSVFSEEILAVSPSAPVPTRVRIEVERNLQRREYGDQPTVIHGKTSLNEGKAVLVKTDGDDAVFDVAVDATSQAGIRMQVTGDARIRFRDTRLVSLRLDGGFASATATNVVEHVGTFRLRRRLTDP